MNNPNPKLMSDVERINFILSNIDMPSVLLKTMIFFGIEEVKIYKTFMFPKFPELSLKTDDELMRIINTESLQFKSNNIVRSEIKEIKIMIEENKIYIANGNKDYFNQYLLEKMFNFLFTKKLPGKYNGKYHVTMKECAFYFRTLMTSGVEHFCHKYFLEDKDHKDRFYKKYESYTGRIPSRQKLISMNKYFQEIGLIEIEDHKLSKKIVATASNAKVEKMIIEGMLLDKQKKTLSEDY